MSQPMPHFFFSSWVRGQIECDRGLSQSASSAFLPSRHFLCPLLSPPSVNDQHFKASIEQCQWEARLQDLLRPGLHQSLFSLHYRCAASPTPRGRQTLQTHQNTTFKRLRVISINSWTLRNQQSALSSETDFETEREGERLGSKTHTVIHTFSLYPWVIEKARSWAHRLWQLQMFVCASRDVNRVF